MTTSLRCWCGNSILEPFSADYLRCGACKTLVVARMPAPEALKVSGDEEGIYGRDYWFRHQKNDLGYPDLEERARLDLPERCLHWLKTLLCAKLPPARVLEIGCAHGGFVALMQAAGFDAVGLELSPFVVRFAQETFRVSVLRGPVEDQHFLPASFDAIVMSDVLEHLPDPVGTLTRCAALLKDDGVLVVQTPLYKGEASIEELLNRNDRFVEHLHPVKGHLFLFSQVSVRRVLNAAGLGSTRFEQALFDYDQYLLAARSVPDSIPAEQADEALGKSPSGRLVRALLDKERALHSLVSRLQACEEDRAARLAVIESQGARIGDLTGQLQACEDDRAARLTVIESQGGRIDTLVRLIESAYPRSHLGIAFRGEVKRIRRVLDEALSKD